MTNKKQYEVIFRYTAGFLAERIHEEVKLIEQYKCAGQIVDWYFIEIVADNLTAYNELLSYPRFVHVKPFLSY